MKALIWIIVLAGLGVGGYFGYEYLQERDDLFVLEEPEEVPTAEVKRRDIRQTIESAGDISPINQVEIKPEVSARIKKIHIQPGQPVERGQLLVELDDNELLTDKAAAETEIEGKAILKEKAQRNFARAKLLYQRKLISREEFENIRSDSESAANAYEVALRQLETIKEQLNKTLVPAPMNGIVLDLPVSEGQVVTSAASVNSGTTLMNIADLSKMYIASHLNQVDVTKLKLGQDAKISINSIRDLEMDGRVRFIAPVASIIRNIKGFTVEVEIVDLDPRVRPGMTADLIFQVDSRDGALTLPLTAIFTENDRKVVFVTGEGSPEPREMPVEVGITNYNFAEITKGLKEGQQVLLTKPIRKGGG
ncbi:MAG: efflux RND transporter periplasmic adaptor subunit [Verrucomicrobiota bacterium]